MQVVNFKKIDKGFLKGSFDLVIPAWCMEIRQCKVYEKEGSRWISMPTVKLDGQDGKPIYWPILKFEKEAMGRLQDKVLPLLKPLIDSAAKDEPIDDDLPF